MGDLSPRNIWISLVAGWGMAAVGALLFRHSEEAMSLVLLLSFAGGITLLHALDRRELRKRGEIDPPR
jgi:hypothetical protein